MDQTSGKEVHCFVGVLAVADIAASDIDHFDDGGKDRRFQESIRRHANSDDGTAGTSVLDGLLERLLRDCEQNDGVCAQALRGGGFDVCDDVLGLAEIDVGLALC